MEKPKSYCEAVWQLEPSNLNKAYHDTAYGFPIENDNELFGRLILEINQAGLSWITILNKETNFRLAYHNFDIEKIAGYNLSDRKNLLDNPGIVRNRLKIEAAIYNAGVVLELQKLHGSFKNWLDIHHPATKDEWVSLFKKKFKFTGGEIVNEFLMSTGYLQGAHIESCPIYHQILYSKPAWMRNV